MNKIRKGDEVVVLVGKDKGKRGVVTEVVSADLVVVDGVGQFKKHVKPNPMKGEVGGIVVKQKPVQVSNVGLFNPATGRADRVGFRFLEDGTKVRFFKANGEVVKA